MKTVIVALFALVTGSALFAAKLPYTYARVGNAADKIPSTSLGAGVALMGGSTDVDAVFQWMSERAQNGDFLVLRATGTDAYNPYIQALCPGANSVATLIVPSVAAANDERVKAIILQAEAVFFAGGDQSDYVNLWKGTKLQEAVNQRIAEGIPVGGTSAGLNVLTQFIYSAQANKGVTSSQALANPFNKYISLDRDFVVLPVLRGLLGDPHFSARDRMGRDLAFLARVYLNGWSTSPRIISVDEETALLISDSTGSTTVVGSGSVYFLRAPGAPEICVPNTPLTYKDINVYRINAGDSFSLNTWSGSGGTSYQVSAIAGVLSSTQSGGSPY